MTEATYVITEPNFTPLLLGEILTKQQIKNAAEAYGIGSFEFELKEDYNGKP